VIGESLSPFGRGADAPLAGRTILQIVPPAISGGDDRSTIAVARALIDAGARALTASESHALAAEVQAIGGLHVPFPASTKNPLLMALNVRRLARVLVEERVDLVHARSLSSAWVALGACRKLKRAVVTTIPGDGPATPPRTSFESAVAEGDRVIAASIHAAERAGDVFSAAIPRLRIVRPGLDLASLVQGARDRERVTEVRDAWGVAPHERVVLAPGRLIPARGHEDVIDAAALIKGRGLADVHFVLAGEAQKPAYARGLDVRATEAGVREIVARAASPPDRRAAFVAASVVVFPARAADGVTRAVIESAAIGALTIACDVGAAREIIAAPPHVPTDQRAGWLVPPGDPAALADAIEAALRLGASTREAIRQRSRMRIAQLFSLEQMTRDTLAVYAEALQERG
jgi:glycosyltransferase involved in cell wall biosynthesis